MYYKHAQAVPQTPQCQCQHANSRSVQDEKERLKAQVAAASQSSTANSTQLVDKHNFIATLQVSSVR